MVTPAVQHEQMWVSSIIYQLRITAKPQIERNSTVNLEVAFSSFYSATCKIPFFVAVEILAELRARSAPAEHHG